MAVISHNGSDVQRSKASATKKQNPTCTVRSPWVTAFYLSHLIKQSSYTVTYEHSI